MTSTWDRVWKARRPPAAAPGASVLQRLMNADGFDSGFANIEENAWKRFVVGLAESLAITPGESLFEVGCGAGALLHPFYEAGHPVGGIDYSPALVELARQTHPGAEFSVGEATQLDTGVQADVVLSMGVFMYFPTAEYAEQVVDLMVTKARRAVAILDVSDLATRADAMAMRERVAGGAAAYAERYAGLDHRYYNRKWIEQLLSNRGLSRVQTQDQAIDGYGNALYRFNAWGFRTSWQQNRNNRKIASMPRNDLTTFTLDQDAIPDRWININADLPAPMAPPLSPATGQPAGPEDLAAIFPMALILQEVSAEPEIMIPDAVRDAYALWRPTPLHRAHRLERALGTPARIYYKYEGVSPAGSHKPNSAVPQAYENAQAGIARLTTETGAGQWGSSLAFACSLFGLECEIYMVGSSYDSKPARRSMMHAWGSEVYRSPSERTESGRANLSHPTGSLGIAISEAVELAAQREDTNYALGSVLNHVVLHQTVVGLESVAQMELAEDVPDVIIGCVGGGSNFGGLMIPFLREKLQGKREVRFLAAEPAACPTLTRGEYRYDYGDIAGLTPMMPMHTLGPAFVPPPVHAGGLRYHGASPLISAMLHQGLIEARAFHQNDMFEAAVQFARTEGILPAPESAHAIRAAIEEALEAKEAGEERVILFNLSGHGHFDSQAYDDYLAGDHSDPEPTDEEIAAAMAELPEAPALV